MQGYITAFPAYGRVYPTLEKMTEDFLNGKDFSTTAQGGPYFSVRDFKENQEYLKDFAGVLLVQVSPKPYFQRLLSREEM